MIELAAPREGVVSRAYLSATEGGSPVTGLSGAQPELLASFTVDRAGGLPHGTWKVVLKAGTKVVKVATVLIA